MRSSGTWPRWRPPPGRTVTSGSGSRSTPCGPCLPGTWTTRWRALAGIDATAPVHIHVAEQRREVEKCLAWSGARPVAWLLDHAPVDARWCIVHATHMDEAEVLALARSGAVAGLCPTTEANLGDGVFSFAEYTRAGGRWGIGSDANVSVSPAAELRTLEYGQRLFRRERNVAAGARDVSTGRTLLDAAWAGGAQASGRDLGRIARGARADLVVLDPGHPHPGRPERRRPSRRVDLRG